MTYDYRPVGPEDLDLLCRHRLEMFRDSGRSEEILAQMIGPFRSWLAPKLAAGTYLGWIAESAGEPVAGLGMMMLDWPPHPNHPTQAERGYVLNVYVEPEHRGRGVAGALMALAVEEGRRRKLDFMALHATDKGRPMYHKLGWSAGREMTLSIK
jgi:GNAT superfamily N-acetyltransferase